MKKIIITLTTLLLTLNLISQTPQKLSYQAVIRDAENKLVISRSVGIRISILQDLIPVYVETHDVSTNGNGLVSVEIGSGTFVSGSDFGDIDWSSGPFSIKTETDPEGGTNYSAITGTSPLLSVPFALHARTAEHVSTPPSETDPVFTGSAVSAITSNDIDTWNNKQDKLTAGTGIQISGNTISVIGGVNPGSTLPVVSTGTFSNVSYRSCEVSGEVTNTGNEMVVARGFCYGTNPSPTFSGKFIQSGNGSGTFNAALESLSPATTYYARAFATNIVGTAYGDEISFATLPVKAPVLTTTEVSNISHTTAQGGGNITDDGGSPLTDRGICWSTTNNPVVSDNHSSDGIEAGNYVSLMSGLTPNTTYYVRAYAVNGIGTGYGNEVSFTTSTLSLASVSTTDASSVSFTAATSGGNVTSDNGSPVTARGVCWSTTTAPTTANNNITQPAGLGSFSVQITGLTPNIKYYARAFAVNGAGTVYGNEISFTTSALSTPVLTTKPVTGISSNIAGSGGNITSDGGSAITAKGVVWSVNPDPTLSGSSTNNGTGPASYNSTLEGLTPLTTYYVRAYATNSLGTTYGNQLSFTTTDLVTPGPTVPTVGTGATVMVNSTSASSGGFVSADGGSPVTQRGVCWSTASNPTISDPHTSDGTGMGNFSSTITGLSGCGTIYYVRAYAINSTGTGYGNQVTVSTGLMAKVTTTDISGISYYSAVSGGTITDNGECAVTQKGVCWSLNPSPTVSNPHTSEGPGSDTFVSNITGLLANKTYYVRAYATNSKGTSYGEEKVFTTDTPSTPYIGQNYAGGIVFYVDGTGLHGLVCAPSDQGDFPWGCQGTSVPGTSPEVGSGAVNTAAILAGCSQTGTAAQICNDLILSGYDDWFLPSLGEVQLMYSNLHLNGMGGFINGTYYISSTEQDATFARFLAFWNGGAVTSGKSGASPTRAVRAF